MINFQQFKELLPKKLECKKVSKYEEIADYKYDVFLGYDENNQVYTITRDKKGNLHVLERDFDEEEREKWEALKRLGEGITLSTDPSFLASEREFKTTERNSSKREIILTPIKNGVQKGYSNITIKLGNETSTIVNNNGNIQLLQDGENIKTTPDEKVECVNILRKPFEVSLLDRLKMGRIPYTGNAKLRHIEETNQYRSLVVPITPEHIREWDD